MRLLLAGLMMVMALPAAAKEGDTFRPFVSYARYYDSNLYRLDESQFALAPHPSDQYGVLSAGLDVDWKPGRQQVIASASKSRVHYLRNTRLDYDGSDYQARWNWRLGNHWSGQVGATENLTQSSFEDLGLPVNNLVTRTSRFGRAEWEFHPRWRIGGGVDVADNTNSFLTLKNQDSHQHTYDVILSYLTPKGSNLGVQVRRFDVEYAFPQLLRAIPYGPFVIYEVADNSYEQTEYNLLGDWPMSGKLKLRGRVGWVERSYVNMLRNDLNGFAVLLPRPDFSGFTGRMSADWYATGKTLLSMSVYQEPGTAQDINASSVLRTGAGVNGVWLVREKWRMNAGATYENRDFKGDPGTTQEQRNDDTLGASLSLSYAPIQAVSLDVGASAGRRDSNMSGEDYKFYSFFASVKADF